jgi:hypothetical protein
MTSTETANWNLLKRGRRVALRVVLGQSLLLLAACGGEAPAGGMTGTMAPGNTGSTAGTPAPGGTAGKPAGNAGSPGTVTPPPGGMAGKPGTVTPPPTSSGGAGGAVTPPPAGGASGGAAGTGAGPDETPPAAGGAGGGDAPTTPPTTGGSDDLTGESSCLADITNFADAGPFEVSTEREGAVNFWVPKVPEGCKVPIVHLANGTGASCSSYGRALERFGTHGFLTACYESAQTGAGTQGVEAFQAALSKYPNLAAKRFGSTGHSQGGQAAFVVLSLSEKEFGLDGGNKFAGLAMQPASGFGAQPAGGWQMQYSTIKSPMFMFSGRGTDGLVPQTWVQDGFDACDDSIEKYHWTKQGGAHIPTPQGEEMQIGPAWFRWKLLGDKKACEYFKSIPMTDSTWEEVAVANAAPCE